MSASIDWRDALALVGHDPAAFTAEDVLHNHMLTPGIWRVTSHDQRFILKCLSADGAVPQTEWDAHWVQGSGELRRWNYWAREALAYQRGVVDLYASGGITAPALAGVHVDERSAVLLLEHVEGTAAEHWDIADYAAAARSLGRGQGDRLVNGGPEHPWLSADFLRTYSRDKPVDWTLLASNEAWAQPLVTRNFPLEVRAEVTWLHDARDRLSEIADRLPQLVCHLDFWTKNLIMRADGTVALLDWSFVGDGAIGEDIGNLVPDAGFDHFVPAESLPALEEAVLSAYTDGLVEAGWTGDPRLAELGMCASAVKYDWLSVAMLASASAKRFVRYGGQEEIDADYRFRERGIALLDNARRARRAITLADELGL